MFCQVYYNSRLIPEGFIGSVSHFTVYNQRSTKAFNIGSTGPSNTNRRGVGVRSLQWPSSCYDLLNSKIGCLSLIANWAKINEMTQIQKQKEIK